MEKLHELPACHIWHVGQRGGRHADTIDWCAALIQIFFLECVLDPSATLTLPPTPSNQYDINTHYAHINIYRAKKDRREKRL